MMLAWNVQTVAEILLFNLLKFRSVDHVAIFYGCGQSGFVDGVFGGPGNLGS
jgi:hypothetical protein